METHASREREEKGRHRNTRFDPENAWRRVVTETRASRELPDLMGHGSTRLQKTLGEGGSRKNTPPQSAWRGAAMETHACRKRLER